MATLCTEIGMPKYRENQKKWKRFLPGNIPANICHRQCLVRVKVSARFAVCAISVDGCALAPQRWGIHIHAAWERAHLCTQPANVRAYVIPLECLQACASTRGCFFSPCTSKGSSPHFLRIFLPSLTRMRACAKWVFFFFTHTPNASSSSAYRQVWADLFACMRVCMHSSNTPLWWAMAAVASSSYSPSCRLYMPPACHKGAWPLTAIIYHTAE